MVNKFDFRYRMSLQKIIAFYLHETLFTEYVKYATLLADHVTNT